MEISPVTNSCWYFQNQSFHGFQSNGKDDTLQEFYMKLSYFLMSGEHSNKEIMEEIERQISNLQEKVKQMSDYPG